MHSPCPERPQRPPPAQGELQELAWAVILDGARRALPHSPPQSPAGDNCTTEGARQITVTPPWSTADNCLRRRLDDIHLRRLTPSEGPERALAGPGEAISPHLRSSPPSQCPQRPVPVAGECHQRMKRQKSTLTMDAKCYRAMASPFPSMKRAVFVDRRVVSAFSSTKKGKNVDRLHRQRLSSTKTVENVDRSNKRGWGVHK